MAIKKLALASRWMSVTDVVDRLSRAREQRGQQVTLLANLDGRVNQRRDDVARSLADLSLAQRHQVVERAVGGHRSELKRQSADARLAHVRAIAKLQDEAASARPHYSSPVQMLMREGLGSERRSRLIHQIEKSGPVELASLAALAASTGDRELGAALCTRITGAPVNERPFSSQELADALVGEEFRTVNQAIMEVERIALEAVHADTAFETGRSNLSRDVRVALMRRDEEAFGADLSNLDEAAERNGA